MTSSLPLSARRSQRTFRGFHRRCRREVDRAPDQLHSVPNLGILMPKMGTSTRPSSRSGGLADALFTRTQQRVLSLIFGQPDRVFLQKELIDQAGSGSGGVRRELDRLTKSGLLTVDRVGAQKHYRANRSAPIFDELRGIVMKTVALTDPLQK